MTFIERLMLVTGERPYEWASEHGFEKALMTSLTRVKGRPQKRSLDKLVAASGIDAAWWLSGDGEPHGKAGGGGATVASMTYLTAHGRQERRTYSHTAAEGSAAHQGELDGALLGNCARACQIVHGSDFAALEMPIQLEYASDLYNLISRMAAPLGRSPKDACRLEVTGLAELLKLLLKIGWARRFPDRRSDPSVHRVF